MPAEKGFPIGELELCMLTEAAVNEFPNSFTFFEEEAMPDNISDA